MPGGGNPVVPSSSHSLTSQSVSAEGATCHRVDISDMSLTFSPGYPLLWSAPRLVCVAGDFTRYDAHAVREHRRSIDLVPPRGGAPICFVNCGGAGS